MTILKHMLGLLLILVLVSACSSANMRGSWASPDHSGKVENVYLVGITENDLVRRIFEDSFSSHLINHGVNTVSSYKDLPRNEEPNREEIIRTMAENGFDSVLFSNVVSQQRETVTDLGYVYYGGITGYRQRSYYGGRSYYGSRLGFYAGSGGYNGRGGYYDRIGFNPRGYRSYNSVISQPATSTEFTIFTVDSVLYDLQTGEKLWLAKLEVDDLTNIEKMVQDYVEVVTKDLKAKGFI